MERNIILTGMPASGKSTVGVILAKILGFDFLDTDLILQRQQKKKLQKIIDTEGIRAFLYYEELALLHSVSLSRNGGTCIATGGSAVFSEKGMTGLKENGVCVYLNADLNELKKRLSGIKTRGVAAAPRQSVEDIMREREPFYLKWADIIIDTAGLNAERTAEAVFEKFCNCGNGFKG